MSESSCVLHFQDLKRALQNNGIFLTSVISHSGGFIVCEKKFSTKWRSLLDVAGPVAEFSSLDEVKAFAVGLVIGKGKTWKY